jgi:hypothetical protein
LENSPREDQSLGILARSLESRVPLDLVGERLVVARELDVGEAVFVGDEVVADAAEGEDEGADDGGAVLA